MKLTPELITKVEAKLKEFENLSPDVLAAVILVNAKQMETDPTEESVITMLALLTMSYHELTGDKNEA